MSEIAADTSQSPSEVSRLALQGALDAGDVACTVVDEGDSLCLRVGHSRPFVLGSMSPSCLSREHATRRARAKALNNASIL